MNAIYGLYSDPDAAQYAVDQLRKAGITDHSITVITSQPYEEYEFSHRYKETWIFWIAAGGGFLGLCAGLGLAYVTEALWPIVTGNMPIIAWWPNIIILFELTMLGAILATVVSLLITAGLPTTKLNGTLAFTLMVWALAAVIVNIASAAGISMLLFIFVSSFG